MATIKSDSEDLTLNAHGSGNDILFQSNSSQVGSLTAEGVLTSTTFAGSGASLTALPAAQLTGTVADARISTLTASKLTGDLPTSLLASIRSDISTLALHSAIADNKAAYNLPSSFIDQFQDDTGIGTETDTDRNASEYVETVTGVAAVSVNMGSNQTGQVPNGTSITVAGDGDLDFSSWVIASNATPNVNDTYGVKIDLGSQVTLASPLRWLPKDNTKYPTGGDGGDDYNAGITEINIGSSDGSGWQFGSGGVTPTVTNSGAWSEWGTATLIYNQDFTAVANGYYHGTTQTTGSDYIQYAWTGTVTGRYIYVSMNPTNGVYNAFTMTDNNGNLFTGSVTNATGTLISTAQTANAAQTKVSGVILYKNEAGTATLGTDLKVYFTCNGGTNWTESTPAAAGTFSSGILMAKCPEVTCTSGTDVRYKVVWANQAAGSKETQLHGIAMNY